MILLAFLSVHPGIVGCGEGPSARVKTQSVRTHTRRRTRRRTFERGDLDVGDGDRGGEDEEQDAEEEDLDPALAVPDGVCPEHQDGCGQCTP